VELSRGVYSGRRIGVLTRAAEQLDISTPAKSRHLLALEEVPAFVWSIVRRAVSI
jgi:hypothetical protein